tara:strand:- start:4908 stop:5096 length:189 start_codon:yes stop_codon:yes gene_type:complete
MKTESQKQLEKYNINQLNTMLEKVEDMLFFPLQNEYKLSKTQLKEMKSDLEDRISELSIINN